MFLWLLKMVLVKNGFDFITSSLSIKGFIERGKGTSEAHFNGKILIFTKYFRCVL